MAVALKTRGLLLGEGPLPRSVALVPFDGPYADILHEPLILPSSARSIWAALRAELLAHDYEIETVERLGPAAEHAELALVFNVPRGMQARTKATWQRRLHHRWKSRTDPGYSYIERRLAAGLGARTVLAVFEPPSVIPENFDASMLSKFGAVVTWRTDGPAVDFRARIPYEPVLAEAARTAFAARKRLVAFVGNKSSGHPLELYSERRAVIAHMEAHAPDQFDFFGRGWGTDHVCWRGTADNKHAVFGQYRFGLCYENIRDTPGYITEKMLDCLVAGTVPVYWGAPDIGQVVDPAAFVDRSKFSSTAELAAHLQTMPEADWHLHREAGQNWLASGGLNSFGIDPWVAAVRRALDQVAAVTSPF